MKYNPKNIKHVKRMLKISINAFPDQRIKISINAFPDQRTFLRLVKNIALENHWELTYQEKLYDKKKP